MAKNVVSPQEWQAARLELLKQEKESTRLLSGLAAKRRELPMVEIPTPSRFIFVDPNSEESVSLLDMFEGRRQLIIYHQMPFNPTTGDGCPGCSFTSDNIPHGPALKHLQSRDTTFAMTSPELPEKIKAFKERMGWTFPFYCSTKDTWAQGDGDESSWWKPNEGAFRLNCFLRDGDRVYRTWETTSRGVEPILSSYALLDMTKLGRQEKDGASWSLHDKY